jgi:D-beta-D-heptose 7-phosphate kinase/D-beta-D-heptose 1-phosphate adenosyltransferase
MPSERQSLPSPALRRLIAGLSRTRILVAGDVMLDHFIWGRVSRISPEAPVPVVDFERESFMPGGAANVARNLTSLGGRAELFGVVGRDPGADQLRQLLTLEQVGHAGLIPLGERFTATKIRIVAGQQQITRLDRETRGDVEVSVLRRLLTRIDAALADADAMILCDYGKGMVTQPLLDALKDRCRRSGKWLSVDPKPVHHLDLRGLSLITPNRKEAFELAGLEDNTRHVNPLNDSQLMRAANQLLETLQPALLLITLGEQGMLLCRRGAEPFHIPTVAREVFDVSGAGDTVIASFTLAVAAGASPLDAAIFSNHAAGVVVGKVGTATVSPGELLASFRNDA